MSTASFRPTAWRPWKRGFRRTRRTWRAWRRGARARMPFGGATAWGAPDGGPPPAATATAAAVVAFLAGGLAGWMPHGASAAFCRPAATLTPDSLDARKVYM